MAGFYEFRWAVDQDGYEIEHVPARASPTLIGTVFEHDVIRPRGGPLREYRPMDDHPGLWRRFGACVDARSALAFVQEFGLLSSIEGAQPSDNVDDILATAESLRRFAAMIDAESYADAAALWNEYARPRLTAGLIETDRRGKFDFRLIPQTLGGALWLQTGEAIAHNQQWRHCRNDDCPEWFRIGQGAHTSRREFCSDRCRVAWARRHKSKQEG